MRKKNTGPKRAIRIGRCSTDDQASGEFTTIDVQETDTLEYVQKMGYIDCGFLKCEGISGTTLNRPDWKRAYEMAAKGEIDVLVATYRSRLGRGSAADAAELMLADQRVSVEYIHKPYTDDSNGRRLKAIDGLVDQLYVESVREHTTTKMSGMFQAGLVCGHLPYGYRGVFLTANGTWNGVGKRPPQKIVIDEESAPLIRQVFDLFISQGKVIPVRDHLNSVSGREWTTTQVSTMLRDERYCGVREFGKWRENDPALAIIERSVWEEAQPLLTEIKKRVERKSTAVDYTYYLHSLVVCPFCGDHYTNAMAKGGDVHYYICSADNKRRKDCPIKRINSDALHEAVMREIKHAATHNAAMHRLIAESGSWGRGNDSASNLRNQLAKKQQQTGMRITNLVNKIADGKDSPAISAALDKLETDQTHTANEINRLDIEIARASIKRPTAVEVQASWADMLECWEEATDEERKKLAGIYIKEVAVTDKNRASMEVRYPHSSKRQIART